MIKLLLITLLYVFPLQKADSVYDEVTFVLEAQTNYFIGAWITVSPVQGQSDTTSVVLVEWWYESGREIASDISRYTITDSIKNYKVYSIVRVDSLVDPDGFVEKPKNTYLYGLVTEKLPYKKFLYCTAKDYGTDYFYFWGYVPNVLDTPNVKMK